MEMKKYKKWQDKAPLLIALGTVLPLSHILPPLPIWNLNFIAEDFFIPVFCVKCWD